MKRNWFIIILTNQKIAVVGGGPAGMAFAHIAVLRGMM